MKLTRMRVLFIAIVLFLGVLLALEVFTSFDLAQAVFSNFAFVMLGMIFVALMSVIGGFFLGMWISARFFSTKGFTPFEEEMLRMREDVKALREKVEAIESSSKAMDLERASGTALPSSSSAGSEPARAGEKDLSTFQ
jgi:hypothetical protein